MKKLTDIQKMIMQGLDVTGTCFIRNGYQFMCTGYSIKKDLLSCLWLGSLAWVKWGNSAPEDLLMFINEKAETHPFYTEGLAGIEQSIKKTSWSTVGYTKRQKFGTLSVEEAERLTSGERSIISNEAGSMVWTCSFKHHGIADYAWSIYSGRITDDETAREHCAVPEFRIRLQEAVEMEQKSGSTFRKILLDDGETQFVILTDIPDTLLFSDRSDSVYDMIIGKAVRILADSRIDSAEVFAAVGYDAAYNLSDLLAA